VAQVSSLPQLCSLGTIDHLCRFHRAALSNRKMDNWTSSLPHTEHCINEIVLYMSNGTEKDSDVNSQIFLKYTKCSYDWKAQWKNWLLKRIIPCHT
jgi:hypothetical protein